MTDSLYPLKILVTGAGSELACSIIKACRQFTMPVHVLGCDITKNAVGRFLCDDFAKVPKALDKDYIMALGALVKKNDIGVVIPCTEAELPVLAKERDSFFQEFGAKILVNSLSEYERFNDKWFAFQWFKKKDIPAPETFKVNNDHETIGCAARKLGFPIMIKPAFGGGSRHIFKALNSGELEKYLAVVPDPLLQEYLSSGRGEYTAGTYRDKDNFVHVIIFKRTLKFGMTNTAGTITDQPDLEAFCRDVILKTNLEGSNNIQFRLSDDGPKVLEINPRFSGTVGLRALCGFNDVEMWVADILNLDKISPPIIKEKNFYRYMEEIEISKR